MKKVLLCIFAFIYLWVSGGVVFSMHYCGDVIADVQPAITGTADCCSSMPEDAGCCHDKLISIKINEAHYCTPTLHVFHPVTSVPPVTALSIHNLQKQGTEITNTFFTNNSPPITDNQRYIFISVFII